MLDRRVRLAYWLGFLLLVIPTGLAMYLFQPFPGSQSFDSARFAWHLDRLRPWTEIGGLALLVGGLVGTLRSNLRIWRKVGAGMGLGLGVLVLWLAYVKVSPAAWFQPPHAVAFARGTSAALPESTLVMGITAGDHARAYPIRLLAYHHRVDDVFAGQPVWVTYCTMCRSGKVFRPETEGRRLSFDLVGAYRYNSVYVDRETGTWWYQANGQAIVGPLAGERLPELLADQMTLGEWLALHPDSEVMQPDPASAEGYQMFGFEAFDAKREDPARGERWQWVVGISHDGQARTYSWSALARDRLVQDRLGDLPLALQVRADGISHRAWDRRLGGRELDLTLDPTDERLVDAVSGSRFGFDGVARGGALDGQRLRQLPASLEYRHSFEGFSGGVPAERSGS